MALPRVLLLGVPLAIGLIAASSKKKKGEQPIPPVPPPGPGAPPPGPAPPAGSGPVSPPAPSPPQTVPAGWIPEAGAVITSLPENYDPVREQMLYNAVNAGLFEPPDMFIVHSPGEGVMEDWTLQIPVMSDALKIEGVRINTTFPTAQAMSDAIGGFMMLTPYVAGLVYEQADARLSPTTSGELAIKDATARKSQMIEASQRVDQKLQPIKSKRDAEGLPTSVANPGKDWVLTIQYAMPGVHSKSRVPKAEAGANHGLYTSPWKPLQNVGMFHGLNHTDYSQTVRFMGTHSVLVDPHGHATQVENAQAITDPDLANMLTGAKGKIYGKQVGEGPLPFARHPRLTPDVLI